MKNKILIAMTAIVLTGNAWAELEVYKDYDLGESIVSMTTIKVDANMGDVYLEGLRETWVESNKIAKELGHIKEFNIFSSELPASGDFNLVLVVIFDKAADLEPSKSKYNAFMKKWGEEREAQNRKISKTYPDVRTITGEYRLREIIMK